MGRSPENDRRDASRVVETLRALAQSNQFQSYKQQQQQQLSHTSEPCSGANEGVSGSAPEEVLKWLSQRAGVPLPSSPAPQVVGTGLAGSSPIEPKRKKQKRELDFSRVHIRHVALLVTYCGWNYHGFAAQSEDVECIESALFKALLKTKLIPDKASSGYSRCGRTDRGVSSVGQVIALRVRSNRPKPADALSKLHLAPPPAEGDDQAAAGFHDRRGQKKEYTNTFIEEQSEAGSTKNPWVVSTPEEEAGTAGASLLLPYAVT